MKKWPYAGADPGFQVRGGGGGGGALKKIGMEEDTKTFWVFRVKNHDFMPKNLIFSNFRGARARCTPPGSASVMRGEVWPFLRGMILRDGLWF